MHRPTIARNSYHATVLTLVRMFLQLATIPILIHGMGISAYGVWAVLVAVLNISLLSVKALGSAASVLLSGESASVDATPAASRYLRSSILLIVAAGGVTAIALATVADPLSSLLFGSQTGRAKEAIWYLSVATLPMAIRQWAISVEAGFRRFGSQAIAESLSLFVTTVGLIVLALTGRGPVELAGWYMAAAWISVPIHLFAVSRFADLSACISIRSKFGRGHGIKSMARFGLAQWASQIGTSSFGQLDRVIVSVVLGPSVAGVYSAATSVASQINVFSAGPIGVVVPGIGSRSEPRARLRIFESARRLNELVVMVLAVALMIVAEPVVRLIIPEADLEGIASLRVLALAYGVYSLAGTGFYAAQGLGEPQINTRWISLAGVVFVATLSLASALFGLIGAAWANLSYSLTLGINHEVERRLGLKAKHFWSMTGAVVAGLTACLVANFLLNRPGADLGSRGIAILLQFAIVALVMHKSGGANSEPFTTFLRGRLLAARSSHAIAEGATAAEESTATGDDSGKAPDA